MTDFETPLECIFSIPPISLGEVNLSGNLNANGVSLAPQQVSNVQYLDIEEDLTTLFNTKQNNITNTTDLTCQSINGISSAQLTNIASGYDISSSLTSLLGGKQPNITSSSDITMHDLTANSINGISSTQLTNIANGYDTGNSSLSSLIGAKTTLSGVQSNANTFTSQNTFSNYSPLCSVAPSTDNNLCNRYYVDTAVATKNSISDVLSNANHFTSTNQFDYLPQYSSGSDTLINKAYVDSGLSGKTTLSAVQGNGNTFTAQCEFDNYAPICSVTPSTSASLANKGYIDSCISSLIGGASSSYDTLLEIQNILTTDESNISTLLTAVGTKAGLSANNTFSGNNVFSGADTFSNTNTFTGSSVYNAVTLSPAQMSNIQYLDISSSLTTQLAGKQPTISNISSLTGYTAPVDLTNSQVINGIKTFVSAPVMSGSSITTGTIPDSALASTFLKTSVASSTYAPLTSAVLTTPTLTATPSTSDNSTAVASTAYVKSNLSSYLTTSSASSTYLTQSNATTTYQPLLSSSVSATVDLLTANRITEKLVAVTGTSSFTLNYANGSVFYISSTQPSSNFSVTISNIPASSSSNQFTVTLIYNSSTACFGNSVTVTDSSSATIIASSTPKYLSGTAPTLTNSSIYIQTFTILQMYSTKYCITNITTFN